MWPFVEWHFMSSFDHTLVEIRRGVSDTVRGFPVTVGSWK